MHTHRPPTPLELGSRHSHDHLGSGGFRGENVARNLRVDSAVGRAVAVGGDERAVLQLDRVPICAPTISSQTSETDQQSKRVEGAYSRRRSGRGLPRRVWRAVP